MREDSDNPYGEVQYPAQKKYMPYEEVSHPQHYNEHPAGIECIDVIEEFSYNIGAAIKYLWRAGLKPDVPAETDLQKAIWCIEREITRRQQRA